MLRIDNKLYWFFIAFVGKLLVYFMLAVSLNMPDATQGRWLLFGGDGPMYIQTATNVARYHTYALHGNSSEKLELYTGRMPGYEPVIAIFLLFFSVDTTLYLVVALQFALAVISIYYLALGASIAFRSYKLFYYVFFLYLFSTYISIFDISILTESFSVSSLIFTFYFIVRHQNPAGYLIGGCLMAWCIFLRQVSAPIFLLFACYIVVITLRGERKHLRAAIINTSLFLVPFLSIDSIWMLRNYHAKGKIIPLVDDMHAGYKYSPRWRALYDWIASWGGDIVQWNPKAEITLFIKNNATEQVSRAYNQIEDLPYFIYTSSYNTDSLKKIQSLFQLIEKTHRLDQTSVADAQLAATFTHYQQSFRKEKPIRYYIYAPLRLLSRFVIHSGTYNISNTSFSEQALFGKAYKLLYTILYQLVLLGGALSIVWIWLQRKKHCLSVLLITIIALYILFVFPLLLRRIEYRYFTMAYPFFLIGSSFLMMNIFEQMKRLKQIIQMKS